jgi:hypothetical protein
MHAIPFHMDSLAPCNAWCQGDCHVDITYDTQARLGGWPDLEAHIRAMPSWDETVEVLDVQPAPEAPPFGQRYPGPNTARVCRAVGVPPEQWRAFRVTYRVRQAGAGVDDEQGETRV